MFVERRVGVRTHGMSSTRFETQGARSLSKSAAMKLKPGDRHYLAYVGPPGQYDFMGASQFNLLCTLGLREGHRLLDFGCGSLRAGRLFIPYLNPGNYFGVEPNAWLIADAIENEIGKDQIALKKPIFNHDDSFRCVDFSDGQFDYLLAQSIFSHTGRDLMARTWKSFKRVLKPEGIAVATFMHTRGSEAEFAGGGWVYPECVRYRPQTLQDLLSEMGFFCQAIPWFHPRQQWYIAVQSPELLLPDSDLAKLGGSIFFDPELRVKSTPADRVASGSHPRGGGL